MGLISRLLGKKEDNNERGAADPESSKSVVEGVAAATTQKVSVPEKTTGKNIDLPEGKVNRETVPYTPAPKPNQVFNPDSNEKDPKTPSYL